MQRNGSRKHRGLVGVITAMALVNLVYGITFPLFALVLDAQGVSKTLIGANTMVQALAVVALAPFAPRLMQRFHGAHLMQASAVLLAALFVLAGWNPDVWFWFPLRFVIGATTAMLWIASEAMINQWVEEHRRGRVVGIYSSVGAAGFALAPVLLIATGTQGMPPFIATGCLTLLAAVPLFWSAAGGVRESRGAPAGLVRIMLLAPAVMLGNVAYAAAAESIATFFPLFGMHLGLAERAALGLVTVLGIGGMVLVLPLGWLADHVNRMGMLLACVLLTMAGLLVMPVAITAPWLSVAYMFAFGGISGMIYTLGVILIGERFKGAMLAAASTAYTACWGVGSVVGPLVVGAGMDWLGVERMTWVIFLLFLFYLPLPLAAWRRSRRERGASAPA